MAFCLLLPLFLEEAARVLPPLLAVLLPRPSLVLRVLTLRVPVLLLLVLLVVREEVTVRVLRSPVMRELPVFSIALLLRLVTLLRLSAPLRLPALARPDPLPRLTAWEDLVPAPP